MYQRYAVFFTPPPGPLADFGAAWLGWDARHACPARHPAYPGLDLEELTHTPRRYGFHATLKAPFRPSEGVSEIDLCRAVQHLAGELAPVLLEDVAPTYRHGFLALRPAGGSAPDTPLGQLAARVVCDLDPLRAPLDAEDLARRQTGRLSPRQRQFLSDWGYPFVLDDFAFHLTLSGRIDSATAENILTALRDLMPDSLYKPLAVDALSLLGEAPNGKFLEIGRFPLGEVTT
ncbi:DUF1045 domain-containing protein [Sulfitobacter sp. D35]|uniref:DUF1045 domain-containing protein n=1 Tax=Sulfitobacter sp. D35 TaxID=3083252 RepID=UPI00296E87ED|nr:DUF1045 domain-containing protein [Sulfitobacter sp. D35]MDW4497956.1 DUF1045 domain-containing protein [Sulfitobacter sp. D35]